MTRIRRLVPAACGIWAALLAVAVSLAQTTDRARDEWRPAAGPLITKWGKAVTPDDVHPEYPRPQLLREEWSNLNGLWDYAVRPKGETAPRQFAGKILVPFPIESALSGVGRSVGQENELWYRRKFTVRRPTADRPQRLLLHFGAVDWQMTAWVNGRQVGQHTGGYDPFSFDITQALVDGEQQELLVRVYDPTDQGFQPRGKQVVEPRGIWYTSVTGIWQTVWTEWVPQVSIAGLKITPDIDAGHVTLEISVRGQGEGLQVQAEALDGEKVVASQQGDLQVPRLRMELPDAKLWSPAQPFLYGLRLQIHTADGKVADHVDSYFGMRKISLCQDEEGINRLCLNNQPLFQFGPLDQGWWPDGLYTPPSDQALAFDLVVTKGLGFNMVRKHVKVEPARWYYHCDRLGLLVWQDMPNGDRHIGKMDDDIQRSEESAANYRQEWKAIMDALVNHPSIVVWVPFNEGWGQFQTAEILAWTKEHDPTRLVDGPSGWTDRGVGDIHDIHAYPGPDMPPVEESRAVVLGEFGGLGLPLENHLWWNKRNWGYRTYQTPAQLHANYETLIRKLRPLISRGLAAAVYTQTTDVEGEVNGLMTYDRAVVKFDAKRLAELHQWLYSPQASYEVRTLVPTSESEPQVWRYTTEVPGENWMRPDYNDENWQTGEGGFGEPSTPGSNVRTEWKSPDIWLRRTFTLTRDELPRLIVRIHHDEDAEIYLNGQLITSVSGYQTSYSDLELDKSALRAVKDGDNVLAVHCRQTGGGQYIDVGLRTSK